MALTRKKRNLLYESILFFALMLIKTGYYFFSYYPLLDDNIQYRVYSQTMDPFNDIVLKLGLLSGRPLAGLMDIYFWSNLFDHMWIALLLVTLMHIAACLILYSLFKRYFNTGPIFLFILGFTPLVSEGTYWLSASTRLVTGLLFAAISALLLQFYFNKKRKTILIEFYIFLMLSFCFYEQTIIFSFFLCIIVLWQNREKSTLITLFAPFICGIIIALDYLFVKTGIYQSRMQLVDLSDGFLQHVSSMAKQIAYVFTKINIDITKQSFIHGLDTILNDKAYFFLILLFLCAGAVFFILSNSVKPHDTAGLSKVGMQLLFGALLFIMPFVLFFFIKNAFISLRTTFIPLVGAAMAIDAVVRMLISRPRRLIPAFTAVMVFVFCVCWVGELNYYRITGIYDKEIVDKLYPVLSQYKPEDKVLILNLPISVVDATPYGEHINTVTSSDWALTGALYARHGSKDFCRAYPMQMNSSIPATYADVKSYDYYYTYENGKFVKLKLLQHGQSIEFYEQDKIYAVAQKTASTYTISEK